MPDLLDRTIEQRTEGDLLSRMAASRRQDAMPYDPNAEYRRYEEIADTAIELNVDAREIDANYDFLFAKPGQEITRGRVSNFPLSQAKPNDKDYAKVRMTIGADKPTTWQAFKRWFGPLGERAPLPPDADRLEKVVRAFDIATTLPLRTLFKYAKGRMLNAPDLMWAALKRMTPDDLWQDEVKHMNLDEAMDWAVGYNPSGFGKTIGEIAEFIGRLRSVAPLAEKLGILGKLPKGANAITKAGEAAKLFGASAVVEQAVKWGNVRIDPTEADYGYEGAIAVLRDMAIGAAFSMVHSGVGAVWKRLMPSEQARLLKVLDLKKGASEQEIDAAARNLLRKYHPDKAKGFEKEFQQVKQAWDKLRVGEEADIVVRGQKVKLKGKLLPAGEAKAKAAIVKPKKPAVAPTKPEKAPVAAPKPITPALAAPSKTAQAIDKIVGKAEAAKPLKFAEEVALSEKQIEGVVKAVPEPTPPIRKGFADISILKDMRDAANTARDTIWTYGEAKRTNPALYDQLMKTYGKRNAAVESAINKLEKIVPKEITLADDVLLARTYETKGQKPPEHLQATYDAYKELLEQNEKQILEEGILKQPFQERMVEENLAKIEELKETLKSPQKSKRIQELVAENERIRNMRYLPHTIVAQNVIESKINRLSGAKRRDFLQRLSYAFKQRKGKMTLAEYLDAGIIPKEDMRMSRLAAQQLTDYYRRSAMKSLHDYAKSTGLVQPASDALREDGWLKASEIGLTSPELKGQLLHPLYAQSLRETLDMRRGRGGLRREIFGMVKIGQFIKPTIIYTYNAIQKLIRGMYSLNPKTEADTLRQAFSAVLNKNALYDKLNESNLYQFPYEVSRPVQGEQIQMWINRHDADVGKAVKEFEKATDTLWLDPDMTVRKLSRNLLTAAHRAIGRLTWMGDKVQRTQSYLILRKMGYGHDDAVKVASQGHGGYSILSKRYKDFMSKFFFVYSFRVLMPIEIAKILTEPIIEGAYQYAKTGVKPSRHKMERWAKAWIAAVAMPVMIDSYMRWRGFEPDGKHLGPIAWKYKKTVVVDGQEHEVVVGLNYILNMPVKYWNRLSSYDPIRPETRWMQSLKNVAKWELHPLYRIFFWDISQNRRSFGTGQNVYDTEANPAVQFGQTVGYIFGQSFRFIGGFMDAMGEGQMTDLERKRQKTVLKEGLSSFDRILFKTLGYNYIRLPLEERKAIAFARLDKQIRTRGIKYHRKYEDEKLDRKMQELEDWAQEMQDWIENDMK